MCTIPPLYVCPDCEPGPYMYAGKVIAKVCSHCMNLHKNAATGYDRAKTGADRLKLSEDAAPRERNLNAIMSLVWPQADVVKPRR